MNSTPVIALRSQVLNDSDYAAILSTFTLEDEQNLPSLTLRRGSVEGISTLLIEPIAGDVIMIQGNLAAGRSTTPIASL